MPGTKEAEEIACPHDACGWSRTQMSNGSFQTAALTTEQEKEYEQSKKRGR